MERSRKSDSKGTAISWTALKSTFLVLSMIGFIATAIGTVLWFTVIFPYYDWRNRTQVTNERIEIAYGHLLEMAEAAGEFPPVESTQRKIRTNPDKSGYDGWSKPFKYRLRKGYVELRSGGADGKIGGDDDIMITSKDRPASFGKFQKIKNDN